MGKQTCLSERKLATRSSSILTDDCTVDSSCNSSHHDAKSLLPEASSDAFEKARLVSLHMGHGGNLRVLEQKSVKEVIKENTGVHGSICFVIRRPGCGLCREDGLALNTLASLKHRPLDGFGLFGIIKETGVDDAGLSEFHSYFPYPLYRDDEKVFYNALGFRRVRLKLMSPIAAASKAARIVSRLKQQKIKTNFKGEGFIQGGIVIFGPDSEPMYIYEERTGDKVSADEVLSVIGYIRKELSEGSLNA